MKRNEAVRNRESLKPESYIIEENLKKAEKESLYHEAEKYIAPLLYMLTQKMYEATIGL
jgi:hypothetical protein